MTALRVVLLGLAIAASPCTWKAQAAAHDVPSDRIAEQLATKVVMEWAFQKAFRGSVLEILTTVPDLTLEQRIGWGLALRKPVMDRELAVSTLKLASRLTEASAKEPLQPSATIHVAGIEARVQNDDYVRSMNSVELVLNNQVTPDVALSIVEFASLPEMAEIRAAHERMKAVIAPAVAADPGFVEAFLNARRAAAQIATADLLKSRELVRVVLKASAK